MTPQHIVKVDFREISAVEIVCSECKGAVILPVVKENVPQYFACPGCNRQLWGDQGAHFCGTVTRIVKAIAEWQRKDNPPFTLGFSLSDTETQPAAQPPK
jgi:uncharacterized protein with PIN domain